MAIIQNCIGKEISRRPSYRCW